MRKIQNLEWVNNRSPYFITEINDNVYHFSTDSGNEYEIALVHYLNIGPHHLDYVYITKFQKYDNHGRDNKLALTISSLLHAYIEENQDALIMFCHKDSPKSDVFQRIFIGWYNTYLKHFPECKGLYKVFHGLDSNGNKQHFVTFYHNGCTQYDTILETLDEHSDKIIQLYYERRFELDEILHH